MDELIAGACVLIGLIAPMLICVAIGYVVSVVGACSESALTQTGKSDKETLIRASCKER